eukprot:CAMPEP_0176192678 /NCGR_PEP_ID=MMETSP0121_2-20121125/5095_1 /TAXON_ID=160619 /ORGANISM="Kryptoperidinium foliaceum, Strain CCMP 1326" /LENGTH=232 /DNA_ID=CAMNT_0017531373 /DNA_START=110 /DNA_END=805 /DNA_ORIENTATION=+
MATRAEQAPYCTQSARVGPYRLPNGTPCELCLGATTALYSRESPGPRPGAMDHCGAHAVVLEGEGQPPMAPGASRGRPRRRLARRCPPALRPLRLGRQRDLRRPAHVAVESLGEVLVDRRAPVAYVPPAALEQAHHPLRHGARLRHDVRGGAPPGAAAAAAGGPPRGRGGDRAAAEALQLAVGEASRAAAAARGGAHEGRVDDLRHGIRVLQVGEAAGAPAPGVAVRGGAHL